MWRRHWKLSRDPFLDAGSPYVPTAPHEEAVARLVAIIENSQRRAVLRAGAGLGKSSVLARAMAGHFGQALALLGPDAAADPGAGRAGRRFTHEELAALLSGAGLEVASVHGIRVFADLVPGSLLDLEPGATAALLELEAAVAARPEYLPLATQLHLLARA